jgi:hypothetical protein
MNNDKTAIPANVPCLEVGRQVRLMDGRLRFLGNVTIVDVKGDLILGNFQEASGFLALRPLFEQFVEAANEMLLTHVDEIGREIDALDLRLDAGNGVPVPPIDDVQIGGTAISFRMRSKAPVSGNGPAVMGS